MDEEGISALEQALADLGTTLVEAQKYVATVAEAEAIGIQARALGAEARQGLRQSTLDAAQTTALRGTAEAMLARLRSGIRDARQAPVYQNAVDHYGSAADGALATLIPQVFAGVDLAGPVAVLFATVAWTRRGRARSAVDLAALIGTIAREGLPADGDDLTSAADARLRAVMFDSEPPDDEAVILQIDPRALGAPLFRHRDSGTLLVYRPGLRVRFLVHVAEHVDLDVAPADYPRYRTELVDALRVAGLDVAPDDTPST